MTVRLKIDCEVSRSSTSPVYGLLQFHSKDLSSTGIQMEVTEELPEGQVLNLGFHIPYYNKPVNVKGLVMWSDSASSGIRFLTLDKEDFELITEFVNKNLPST